VVNAGDTRVFLTIREPSMVLTADLPDLSAVEHWRLPSGGAHGMDIDHDANLLYVACDDGALVEVKRPDREEWAPMATRWRPDATFFNPSSGCVHVAIAKPGLVQSIDLRTGAATKIATATGAKTTALVTPDRLYVLSPSHGGVLELAGA
jgi:hypothetical protein